jgi:hypothetical protein
VRIAGARVGHNIGMRSAPPCRRGPRWGRGVLAVPLAAVALAVLPALPAAAASERVRLSFDEVTTPYGTVQSRFVTRGSAPVRIDVVTRDGGAVRSAAGHAGSADRAVRFPAHDPSSPAARAVIRIRGTGTGDALDPGTGRFEFGADLVLDGTSSDTRAGSVDDGDNLVQRGLWDDRSQYKLELDARRPTCRVKGWSGTRQVIAAVTVQPGRWYRVRCVRNGTALAINVTSWSSTGATSVSTRTTSGATGRMTPSSSDTPLTVGGKLYASGSMVSDTDQFNGRVDNVVFRVG